MKLRSFQSIITFSIMLLLTNISGNAQKTQLKYISRIQGDVLYGAKETTGSLSTDHGITYKDCSVTLGTGMDFYRYRTIPVFLNIQRTLAIGKMQPFVQAAGGLNIADPTQNEKIRWNWWGIWP